MRAAATVALSMLAVSASAQMPTTEPRPAKTVLLPQPIRVLDTRLPGCQVTVIWPTWSMECARGRLRDGEIRYTQFQALTPAPFHSKGVILSVTAVAPTGDGYLTLYDPFPVTTDFPIESRPLASSLNFTAGVNTSNSVLLSLGQWQFQAIGVPFKPDSAIYARVADGGTVDVVMDLVGYLE